MYNEELVTCNSDDSITALGLSVRVSNALRRSDIETIATLVDAYERDELWSVRNLGEKGIAEIGRKLDSVTVVGLFQEADYIEPLPFSAQGADAIFVDWGPPQVPLSEVVAWQITALGRQLSAGVLHPNVEVDGETIGSLVSQRNPYDKDLCIRLSTILSSPLTVAQELSHLLSTVPTREIDVICKRFGFNKMTLQAVAETLDITRERVRQLQQRAVNRMRPSVAGKQLLRIRSAMRLAEDLDISFKAWSVRIRESGLMGVWIDSRLKQFDATELMIATVRAMEVAKTDLTIPPALECILQLRNEGRSDMPARVMLTAEMLTAYDRKLVLKHLRHSGAVCVDWLAAGDDVSASGQALRDWLVAQDFIQLSPDWYMSLDEEHMPTSAQKGSVFHGAIFKMTTFCGPLSLRDIYFGLEHTLVKTEYPLPPMNILPTALENYGYTLEEGLWCWNGELDEALNRGEQVILQTITSGSGVAHHNELGQAILTSELSYASLHGTLRRSPLFDKFEHSLYKLRGTQPDQAQIERARRSAHQVRVELKQQFDMDGNVLLSANLGPLAVGHGTISSERLPNLPGTWELATGSQDGRQVTVTDNELRGLLPALQLLDCQVGDRISMKFNTETRQVTVSLFGDDA